jgi:hypothetical protein
MMFRRVGFFKFLLIGFLIISLFGLIRSTSYHSGWVRGFAAGQTADDTPPASEDAPPAAQTPYSGSHWGWGGGPFSPFFWMIGGFFKFLLFLFLFGLIFKLFHFGRWRHRHSHKEWKHHHSHTPPWYDDSGEEPVMKA